MQRNVERVVFLDWTSVVVVGVLFFATFVRSTFGFGEALIAVPILAFFIPIGTAVAVATLVSITIAMIVVVQDWRHIHWRSAGWLSLASAVGTPVGLIMLTTVPEGILKGVLAGVIVAFSVYSLSTRRPAVLNNDRFASLFGFAAGILGGAYSMNGPLLAIYGALRGWSPQHFRATLQGYFLPASVFVMVGYWWTGLWTPIVMHYYLLTLPAAVAAILLGRAVNRRMRGDSFFRYVYMGLIGVGVMLFVQVGL